MTPLFARTVRIAELDRKVSRRQHGVWTRWWRDWWKDDYSWAGLSKRLNDLEFSGGKGLQAYWRHDPATGQSLSDAELLAQGLLVKSPTGVLWHIAHVPLTWRGGAPAKSAWDEKQKARLAAVIDARCAAADSTRIFDEATAYRYEYREADTRAQLSGVVAFAAPAAGSTISGHMEISAVRSFWMRWDGMGRTFGSIASFSQALLMAPENIIDFSRCVFVDDANFVGTVFFDHVDFFRNDFQGDAHFESAVFCQETFFKESAFAYYCGFSGADFHGFVSFAVMVCQGAMAFNRVWLRSGGTFSRARIEGVFVLDDLQVKGPSSFDLASGTVALECDDIVFREAENASWLAAAISWLSLAASVALLFVPAQWLLREGAVVDFLDDCLFVICFVVAYLSLSFIGKWIYWWLTDYSVLPSIRKLSAFAQQASNEKAEIQLRTLQLKYSRYILAGSFENPFVGFMRIIVIEPVSSLIVSLYGLLSDFGNSIVRPLVFALTSIMVFSCLFSSAADHVDWRDGLPVYSAKAVYAGKFEYSLRLAPERLSKTPFAGLDFSVSNALRPFHVWDQDADQVQTHCTFEARLMWETTAGGKACTPPDYNAKTAPAVDGHRLAIKLLASAQSLLSVACGFFLLLAVRRKMFLR